MANEKDSFLIHAKLLDIAFKQLKTDAQLGQLLKAMYAKHKGEDYEPEDPFVSVVFDFFANQLSIDKERYDDICRKRKEAINKRWGKTSDEDTKNTNVSYNDNVNDNVDDNDVSNETDIKEKTIKENPPSSPDTPIGQISTINGKQVVRRANNVVFVIPQEQEVEEWIKAKGYHFSAKLFIDYYSNSSPHPWCRADGTPVKNWRQCCTSFESTHLRSEGRRSLNYNARASTEAHANINQRQYEQF